MVRRRLPDRSPDVRRDRCTDLSRPGPPILSRTRKQALLVYVPGEEAESVKCLSYLKPKPSPAD